MKGGSFTVSITLVAVVMLAVLVSAAATSAKVPERSMSPKDTLPATGRWFETDRVVRPRQGRRLRQDPGQSRVRRARRRFRILGPRQGHLRRKNSGHAGQQSLANAYISMYFTRMRAYRLRSSTSSGSSGRTRPSSWLDRLPRPPVTSATRALWPFPQALPGASAQRSAIRSTSGRSTRLALTASTGRSSSSSPAPRDRAPRASGGAGSGYPDAIINVETISPVIAPLASAEMGRRRPGWASCTASPFQRTVQHWKSTSRTRPISSSGSRPSIRRPGGWAWNRCCAGPGTVPVLRVRCTGHTEMELWPAVQRLRKAILEVHGTDGKCDGECNELETHVWTTVTREDNREVSVEKPTSACSAAFRCLGLAVTRTTSQPTRTSCCARRRRVRDRVRRQSPGDGQGHYSSVSIYADQDRFIGRRMGPSSARTSRAALSGTAGRSGRAKVSGMRSRWRATATKRQALLHGSKAAGLQGQERRLISMRAGEFLTGEQPSHVGYERAPDVLPLPQLHGNRRRTSHRTTNELVYDRAIYFGPYLAP